MITSLTNRVKKASFTIVELLVVMGITATLFSLTTIRLFTAQHQANLSAAVSTFISDAKRQQLQAIAGNTQGQPAAQDYGIFFETNRYTLFRGLTYLPGDSYNYVVNLDNNITLTPILFPQAQAVFSKGSGEIAGYSPEADVITFIDSVSGKNTTVRFNRLGVITDVN